MTAPERHPPVAALSKSERAYQWLHDRITGHDFTPGYRLVLGPIARELDMSVVPVREAIRRLEAEGLVTFERNIGAHVAMIDDSQYRNTMHTLGILEGAATALAAPSITTDHLAQARGINAELKAQLESFNPEGFTALNQRFHAHLFRRCPNPRLTSLVEAEWTRLGHLRASTFAFVPGRARQSVQEHEQILSLIEGHAPTDEIEASARGHRWATLEAYLAHEHPELATATGNHGSEFLTQIDTRRVP